LSWIASLKCDEKFKCGLIRPLFEAMSHLFPMLLEDIRTSTTRFLAEPTIRLWSNFGPSRASVLALETNPANKRLILLTGKSSWKLDAQLLEKLRGVDVGEFL